MTGRIARALALVAIVVALLAPSGAHADVVHHAAVIVDTGTEVHRVVVEFSEDSITGLEALRRAGADPVVWTYSGQGGAVCRLFGVGRDAGPGCLGGASGDARYWAYFRAPSGTSSFSYAQVGAASATVRDGDVEGWRYGTGQAPPYTSVAALLGTPPPSSVPPTTVPAPSVTTTPRVAPVAGAAPATTTTAPSAAPAPTDQAQAATPTTHGPPVLEVRTAASRRRAVPPTPGSDAGSATSLLGFAAVAGLLGTGIVLARRARVRRRAA